MTRMIRTYEECRCFAAGFQGDPHFSAPMLCSEEQVRCNLIKSIENPDRHCVFGVYQGTQMIGLFAFLVPAGENYIEMLVGLSREKEAYTEMFAYLEQHYPGYGADFVFNSGNSLLKALLEQHPEITAVCCQADIMLPGVLRAIRDVQRTPGEDVAVVSFDGLETTAYSIPSVTTFAQPYKEMTDYAQQLMIGLLKGDREHQCITFNSKFIQRESF